MVPSLLAIPATAAANEGGLVSKLSDGELLVVLDLELLATDVGAATLPWVCAAPEVEAPSPGSP